MNKEKSQLIMKIKGDIETQLRKMGDAQQRFYNYVNHGLNDLEEMEGNSDTNPQRLINDYLSKIGREIDNLGNYYQKQLKPFLDKENDN